MNLTPNPAPNPAPPAAPPAPAPSPARRRRIVFIGLALLLLIVALFLPQALDLRAAPSPGSTWLLFLLSTLSFLAIVILTIVLVRQIAKLYAERRANVLGSKFKTKLVIGALGLSLTPVVCMFGFTYGLINRTLDKWFSQPVVAVRDDSQAMLDLLTNYVEANAQHEAIAIGENPGIARGSRERDWGLVRPAMALHEKTLEGGYALILDPLGHTLFAYDAPTGHPAATLVAPQDRVTLGGLTYVLTHAPLSGGPGYQVVVAMPIPSDVTAQLNQLRQDADNYNLLHDERRSLRFIYTGYLLLLTLAVLFCATWMALFLSKMVTVPIADLAAATQEISRGNLAYRVRGEAKDEIGSLVESFNRMAGELETNRAQIEASRRYTEALLENTPSAVLSLDRHYAIERANPAVRRLFGGGEEPPRRLEDLFDPATLAEIRHLLRKSERWPAATGQMEATVADGRALTLAVTVAALPGERPGRRPFGGYVLVIEDLTDLLRIQKTAAWREVAQRIAHEIKNPLTPIALSAQRIQRRLGGAADPQSAVIAECAATIETEARSLARLVDEFSQFARFPRAQPVSCDLNDIIDRALRAFDGRLDGIEIRTQFDPLPPLHLDPEDMKRVFVNLIDNAAEAMHASPYRRITLSTRCQDGAVEAVVADTGEGLPAGDKQRLFLPYFSTKQRGSGLGLAIVLRIVEENGGALRVEDNPPIGARFIVDLPIIEAIEVLEEPVA